jgi:hypothetical protein
VSEGFAARLPAPKGNGQIRLWLKSSAYARRVLLGENIDPWVGPAQYLAFFSQAQALLKPDVAVLELTELFDSHASAHPEWSEAVHKRRRPASALRRLLESEAPRQLLAEVIEAVLVHLGGRIPLVLALPSPRRWIQHANALTGSEPLALSGDDVEDGAMYIADLLRSVSTQAVSWVMFEEPEAASNFNAEDLAHYQSVVNVIRHYRWSLALRLPDSATPSSSQLAAFDAVITSSPALTSSGSGLDAAVGCDFSTAFAEGSVPAELGERRFAFVEIEPGLRPESVLERLTALRGA